MSHSAHFSNKITKKVQLYVEYWNVVQEDLLYLLRHQTQQNIKLYYFHIMSSPVS